MYQVSLKAARVNANLTQKQAASIISVDVSTIKKWEKCKTYPKADQLQKLCDAYAVPMDNIFLSERST